MLYEAWGVLLNDLFDREADRIAGKSGRTRGHSLSAPFMVILILLTGAASWALILYSGGTPLFYFVWVIAYVLGTIYSAPPIRLKNRGVPSLVCNSILERPLPVLLVFLFFRYYGPELIAFPLLSELVWSVFKHQVHDIDKDSKANIRTFAVSLGKELSYKLVKFVINPLSVAAVLAFTIIAGVVLQEFRPIFAGSVVVILAGLAAMTYLEHRSVVYTDPIDPPYILFLNLAFLLALVLVMGIIVLAESPTYFPLVALFLVSLTPYLRAYGPMVAGLSRKILS